MVVAGGVRQACARLGLLAVSWICAACGDRRLLAISEAVAGAGGSTAQPPQPEPASCSSGSPSLLPPMGWNGWNEFRCRPELDEAKFRANVDALVSSGMKEAGYRFANLDDCWQSPRAADGSLTANERFPSGIGELGRYVHASGLKLGIDAHNVDCAWPELTTPGSVDHEIEDAATFATWGVDYVKYARCGGDSTAAQASAEAMREALNQTGRSMLLSLVYAPLEHWQTTTAQLWRTYSDIEPSWDALLGIVDAHSPLAPYGGQTGFNDADMLWVGHPALSEAESRAHFSLWAIWASPLLAGTDLSRMSATTAAILTNREVIALNQDPLTLQAVLLEQQGDVDVYAKPLAACGARGVVLLNRGAVAVEARVTWQALGLAPGVAAVRDLWLGAQLEPASDSLTVVVEPHDVRALRIEGTEPPLPQGDVYLSDLPWTYAANGWGPVERDREVGDKAAADGAALSLGGTRYEKGLGTNSPSLVRYRLGQNCRTLSVWIGIDDVTGDAGSAIFQVWADREKLFDSGVVYGNAPPRHIELDVTNRSELRLFVGEVENIGLDHADWADARLSCD